MTTRGWKLRTGLMTGCLALLSVSPGCYMSLQIGNISVENPALTVGDSTHLIIEANSAPGRTVTYFARATRGRILPEQPTTSKILTYYAPFTSKAPDASGNMVTGDTITVQVDDGSSSQGQVLAINLGGNTISYVDQADSNGYGLLKLATTDDSGSQVTNAHSIKDSFGNAVKGAEPTISPDGKMIAFVDYSSNSPSSAIRTIDTGGKVQTIVPAGDTSGFNLDPSWAPSSHELVFASDRLGNFDIYRVPTTNENGSVQAITKTSYNERFPSWNPSFQQYRVSTLAVSAQVNGVNGTSDANSAWNLFLVDIQSGRYLTQLTDLVDRRDYAFEPRWRSDGQVLAYTRFGPVKDQLSDASRYQRIYIQDISLNQGSGKLLNLGEQSTSTYESNPVWNDMGNQIAYLKSFTPPNQAAQAQVMRQTVNGLNSTSEVPQPWKDFASPLSALWFQETQSRPMGGDSFGWH